MVFSSLNFLLIFLPIVLLLHSVLPFKYKNIVLLAASIIFYAWGEPVYVILMILSIGFNYMSGLVLGELEDPHLRKRQLIFAVAVNLLLLGFFKYAGFLVSMINAILPLKIEFRSLALPVGISFYTFQALSYVIDVYRKKVKPQENLLNFAVYITMFPQLVAGPIVKYSDIRASAFQPQNIPCQIRSGHRATALWSFQKSPACQQSRSALRKPFRLRGSRKHHDFMAWYFCLHPSDLL